MSRILHICWGTSPTNGAANIARMIIGEQRAAGHDVALLAWLSAREVRAADEVWCHCGWYYGIWLAVFWARLFRKRIRWVPECCYDPVRLAYHGWKKRLVGPVERWALRQCDEVVATCRAEADWVRAYEPRVRAVTVTNIQRFFHIDVSGCASAWAALRQSDGTRPVHVLYLGRPHVLKGTDYLVRAVSALNACGPALPRRFELRMASAAQGDEKDALWKWADVFALPTLSDNFGLVVAEALERGKPVVTTDGAPAWLDLAPPFGICVRGFRAGTDAERTGLLQVAFRRLLGVA